MHAANFTFPILFTTWDFSLHIVKYNSGKGGQVRSPAYDAAPLRILEYPGVFVLWRALSTAGDISRFKIVLYAVQRRVVGEGYRAVIGGPILYAPMTLKQAVTAVKSLATDNKGISWLGNSSGVPKLKEGTPAEYEKRVAALRLTDHLFLSTSSEWEASRPAWAEARERLRLDEAEAQAQANAVAQGAEGLTSARAQTAAEAAPTQAAVAAAAAAAQAAAAATLSHAQAAATAMGPAAALADGVGPGPRCR